MTDRVSVETAIRLIARGVHPPLIAIDGLPCAGKGTLVNKLKDRIPVDCIHLDEFVLPEAAWPSRSRPMFPFPFMRYGEFLDTVKTLATTGACSYLPFHWDTLSISDNPRHIRLTNTVVVEGVSSLNEALCDLYGLKVFVESDRSTALQAAISRGVGAWEKEWRELFLPSSDIYMRTHPERRADLLVPGRGIV